MVLEVEQYLYLNLVVELKRVMGLVEAWDRHVDHVVVVEESSIEQGGGNNLKQKGREIGKIERGGETPSSHPSEAIARSGHRPQRPPSAMTTIRSDLHPSSTIRSDHCPQRPPPALHTNIPTDGSAKVGCMQ
ncbi:hypothetical protein SESBI_32827 [Sesbania bispinosa]|nr:hypothetical protein SESBI_32827 [Sesbania bispinosa]